MAAPASTRAYRDAIDNAFLTKDFVSYREMYDYSRNLHAVIDTLRDLLAAGHAQAVIELAEHALERAEDALGYVDDSDGHMRESPRICRACT